MVRLARPLAAETLGTTMLLAVVIGSGIMAERLSSGHGAMALMANTLATVAGLFVLIEILGPISGAHFNPVVTVVMACQGRIQPLEAVQYCATQAAGATCGAWLAHLMFGLPLLQLSTQSREGIGLWLGEIVATAGLVLVVLSAKPKRAPALVSAYIGAAYWFTSSTSFANPAAVIGRLQTDSFTGIALNSAAAFVVSQILGAGLGLILHRALQRDFAT